MKQIERALNSLDAGDKITISGLNDDLIVESTGSYFLIKKDDTLITTYKTSNLKELARDLYYENIL